MWEIASISIISLVHTLNPSHWLPFVLVGQANKWGLGKTLWVTCAAGALHVTSTILLGMIIIFIGYQIIDPGELDRAGIAILILLGVIFMILYLLQPGTKEGPRAAPPEKGTIISLSAMMALSPCEGAIPVFLAAGGKSILVMLSLCLILTMVTIGGMIFLVTLSFKTLRMLRLHLLHRYEYLIIGALLCLLGVLGTIA
jgi:hypothetical protein